MSKEEAKQSRRSFLKNFGILGALTLAILGL